MWFCLGERERERQQASQRDFVLFSVAMAPVLPRPRWLTHKLSLFTCLYHCCNTGQSLHYAKDKINLTPLLCPQLLLNPSIYRGKEDRSKWSQCEVPSCLMGPDSFLLSPLPSTVYQQHMFLQGYKLAAAAAKINNVQKQEGRKRFISFISLFIPGNFPLKFHWTELGLMCTPNLKEAQKWSIWIFSFIWKVLARKKGSNGF